MKLISPLRSTRAIRIFEISTINNLIETLKDGQEGFKQAIEGVKSPQLKSHCQLESVGESDVRLPA